MRAPSAAIAAHCAACVSLPPKRAAHAPHLDRHRAVRDVEHVGDEVLHLARMLGRGMDEHVAVLARNGERDLAFEIEMLLPADAQRAGDAVRRGGERVRRGRPCANV